MENVLRTFATNEGVQPEGELVTLACDRSLDEGEAVIRATFDPTIGSTGREFFVQVDPTEADVLLALIEVAGDCGGDKDAAEVVERFRERLERVRTYRDLYYTVPGHYTQDFEGKRDGSFADAKARALATIHPFDGIPGESRAFVDERTVERTAFGETDGVARRWEVYSDGTHREMER